MIEDIKNLNVGKTVEFDDPNIIDFIGDKKLKIKHIHKYTQDDIEILLVIFDDYCLGAHCVESVPKYYIYELTESGSVEDLENDGLRFVNDENDFRSKIIIRDEYKSVAYKHSDIGAMYDLSIERFETEDEPAELSLCEYVSKSSHLTHIIAEHLDDTLNIYHGFRIKEDSIILR